MTKFVLKGEVNRLKLPPIVKGGLLLSIVALMACAVKEEGAKF